MTENLDLIKSPVQMRLGGFNEWITAVSLAGGAAETWIAVVALLFIGTK